MLAINTTDNWSFFAAVGAAGHTEFYTASATANNAYSSIVAFVDWLNDPARAWHASRAWVWSWARGADSGAVMHLTCTGDFVFLGTAPLGFVTTSAGPTLTGTTSAIGTWAPTAPIGIRRHQRLLGDGDCGGSNTIRPGVPGLSGFKPSITAIGTPQDAIRLTIILATAENPRVGTVWQTHSKQWRTYAIGQVERSDSDSFYRFNFSVAGEVQ